MRTKIFVFTLAAFATSVIAAQAEDSKLRLKPGLWDVPTQIKLTVPPGAPAADSAAAAGNMQAILAMLAGAPPLMLNLKVCVGADGTLPPSPSARLATGACTTSFDVNKPTHSLSETLCTGAAATSTVLDAKLHGPNAVNVVVTTNTTNETALLYSIQETMTGKWTKADCGDCAGKGTCNLQEEFMGALQKLRPH